VDQLFDTEGLTTLTVSELSQRIALALRRAFTSSVWVEGEIHSLSRPASGHVYFDLVEPSATGRRGAASIPVVLWESDKHGVNQTLKNQGAGLRMTDGLAVRIRGTVTLYAAQSRVQLQMSAIDPAYTLGRMAAERDRLLQALQAEGLLDRNARQPLPAVPLRVGLVTSDGSAACEDFLHELDASALGWQVRLFHAQVQGMMAGPAVATALHRAAAHNVDVIALVRGGGARSDLAAFDSEIIARAIAHLPVPVLTGIGHETDDSVADAVAHTRYKTPTACAAGLVDHVRRYTTRRDEVWRGLVHRVDERLHRHQRLLDGTAAAVVRASRSGVRGADVVVGAAARQVATCAPRITRQADRHLDGLDARVKALDPSRALARGWSITRTADGRVVRSPADVVAGDRLHTRVAEGEIRSVVDA
jgi:exodeoxyribonuclease VII large subunit